MTITRIDPTDTAKQTELNKFYIAHNLELTDEGEFPYPYKDVVFSYELHDNSDNFVGAVTICSFNDDFMVGAICVLPKHENKGYGGILLQKAIDELSGKNIFTVAKKPDFFAKHGFKEIKRKNDPLLSDCYNCHSYQKNCFPKVMKLGTNKV
ncbi:MAG: GNAT family N-acetyltransferase [Firmicutes bacterium]|nr:GNAT family N-acetyltransferase [Bacillota bacterium]